MKEETDFYICLCNIAGSLLQGGPLELEGKTYVGDEARKKGMQIIDLIRVLDVYFENKQSGGLAMNQNSNKQTEIETIQACIDPEKTQRDH